MTALSKSTDHDWPFVLTQIPIFNESQVTERCLRAVAAIDYTARKHHLQILDDSTENAMLVPMAVSLGFGLLFATVITLYLIPTSYLVMEEMIAALKRGWAWYRKPFVREEDEREIPESSDRAL
jgi:cellulose synthase/poly-beta-1,6-N-acetylglucosamine synthase-like glycosyltransferase